MGATASTGEVQPTRSANSVISQYSPLCDPPAERSASKRTDAQLESLEIATPEIPEADSEAFPWKIFLKELSSSLEAQSKHLIEQLDSHLCRQVQVLAHFLPEESCTLASNEHCS